MIELVDGLNFGRSSHGACLGEPVSFQGGFGWGVGY